MHNEYTELHFRALIFLPLSKASPRNIISDSSGIRIPLSYLIAIYYYYNKHLKIIFSNIFKCTLSSTRKCKHKEKFDSIWKYFPGSQKFD